MNLAFLAGILDMRVKTETLEYLERWVDNYSFGLRIVEKGCVSSVGDGIAWVEGLPLAAAEEILKFEDGSRGMVFEVQSERLGVILLDPEVNIASGSQVSHTGRRLDIGVGNGLLSRVIDPLGRVLDSLPPYKADSVLNIDANSPSIIARDFVNRPLYTGIKVVDTFIPIGRGQRQLIIGDLGTGKSSLALDTVVAQAGEGVKCVYVMIGQKRSEIVRVIDLLRKEGALEYTTVVVAEATDTPGMKYLAPFAGCAIAEGWMQMGDDTLVVYDDLSTHARAYRELSLLMHRPPGREAYPGDIFYLHARLLERSTRLSPEHGGGSMSALPIVETQEGEIAAYIPTNLISITDGQIYLNRRLQSAGILPAVDVSLSVSRIGGKAQHPRIKEQAGKMKLEYLQFLELEVFTRFGTKLEAGAELKIKRGRILREILKQERLTPLPAVFELAWLIAYNEALLEIFDIADIPDVMQKILDGTTKSSISLDSAHEQWLSLLNELLGSEQ